MQVTVNVWTLLAGAAIGMGLYAGAHPAQAAAAAPAVRYEYRSEQIMSWSPADEAINKMAAQGWEPWAVTWSQGPGHPLNTPHTVFYRRARP